MIKPKNRHALRFKELQSELEKVGLPIDSVKSRRNGKQKTTDMHFKNQYVRRISFVDGQGYYEYGKAHFVNVYCGTGDTKDGAWFKNYKELASELLRINNSFFHGSGTMVPTDLHIHKSILAAMEKGDIGTGYILVPEEKKDQYELINKHAFQPGARQVDDNSYDVVFILK